MSLLDYTVYISEQRIIYSDHLETPGLKGTYICFEISEIFSPVLTGPIILSSNQNKWNPATVIFVYQGSN